jgi:hypothetical protein
MIYFLFILLFSLAGLAVLLGRRYLQIKNLSREELLIRLNETRDFWIDFHELLIMPMIRVYSEEIRPFTLKEIEKIARRTRIMNLKLECLLLRFTNYIKGKRELRNNGKCQSSYWQELHSSKNSANHQEDKPA